MWLGLLYYTLDENPSVQNLESSERQPWILKIDTYVMFFRAMKGIEAMATAKPQTATPTAIFFRRRDGSAFFMVILRLRTALDYRSVIMYVN